VPSLSRDPARLDGEQSGVSFSAQVLEAVTHLVSGGLDLAHCIAAAAHAEGAPTHVEEALHA